MASLINTTSRTSPAGLRLRLELKGSRIAETKRGSLTGIVIALDGTAQRRLDRRERS